MNIIELKVIDIINNIEELDENYDIYTKTKIKTISLDDIVVLSNEENFQIIYKNLYYLCGIYTFKDIISNLSLQKENYNFADALNAVNFYLLNDSFIEF